MTESTVGRVSDRPWSEPLGSPYLSSEQRRRLAEDLVLVAEAGLNPDDSSPGARQVRATAEGVRDHRHAAKRLVMQESLSPANADDRLALADVRVLVPRDVIDVAGQEWQRLGAMRQDARVVLVAGVAWQPGYAEGFATAYTTAAAQVIASAADTALADPSAWSALHPLAIAARDAISELDSARPAPPSNRSTLGRAQAVVGHSNHDRRRPPARQVAEIAWRGGRTAGALAGTLAAATDILIGWRARGGERRARGLVISGQPARMWIADLLAAVNRDAAGLVVAQGNAQLAAVRLARQDHAPGATASTGAPTRRDWPTTAAPRSARPARAMTAHR